MTYAITRRHAENSLPSPPKSEREGRAIRRIFNNEQFVERFGQWLEVCGNSQHTRCNYIGAAKQFARFLVDKPFTSVVKEDVRAFLGDLYARNLAASTMASRLYALRSLFNFLELGNQVHISAMRYIQTRKVPKRLPKDLSEECIGRLFAAAATPRERAVLELLYATGLRVSELANLRIEDVNLRARSLIVRRGKGDKDRLALFGEPAAAALQKYLGGQSRGFVLASDDRRQHGGVSRDRYKTWWGYWRETAANGKRVMRTVRLGDCELPTKERARLAFDAYLKDNPSPDTRPNRERALCTRQIERIVQDVAQRAGLGHVTVHQFRHSFATHCLNHGMDIRFVQELLGHANVSTTQKYLHVATANLQSAHAKFHPRG